MSKNKILGGAEFRKEFELTLNSAQKSGILGFDPTERAPNAIEWIIRREFLNSPRILNHWGQFQLVRDFFELLCPFCAKEEDIECWGMSKEAMTSQPLLVWSKSWEEDMCWAPGTLVRTIDGHKKIEDIQLNDEVLTHEGRYRKVIDTKKNLNKNLLQLRSVGVPELKCTDVHPFLIFREEDVRKCRGSSNGRKTSCRPDEKGVCKRCDKNINIKPLWVEAKDINVGDYLLTKLDKSHDVISVGVDKAKLLGLYLGDGHVIKKKLTLGNVRNKGFGITLDKSAKEHLQSILDVCNAIPTKNLPKIHDHKDNALLVRVHDQDLTKWLIEHAGNGSFDKRLHESVFNWHQEEKMALLGGYLDTDGCIDRDGKVRFATSNRGLALDIRRLILSLRIPANVRRQKASGGYLSTNEFSYIIEISSGYSSFLTNFSVKGFSFDKSYKSSHGFFFEEYFATPIKRKETLTEEGFVYNLTVEEDESYHAEGIISHNCPKCRKTRSEIEEAGDKGELPNMNLKFNRYNQLHGVIGMRCVPLSKVISTLNGLRPIKDLLTEEHYANPGMGIPTDKYMVQTKDGISGVTHVAYMGKKPISVTKFKSGFVDRVSTDHKYRILDAGMNFFWKEAKDLKKGDVVVRRLGTRSFGTEKEDLDFLYCMGALMNSGSYDRFNVIHFKITRQADNEVFVDSVIDRFKKVFGEKRVSIRFSPKEVLLELKGKDIIERVEKFGLKLNFRENISTFPIHILNFNKSSQAAFLSGFFDVGKDYKLTTPYKFENQYTKRKKSKVDISYLNENQGQYRWPEVRFFCKNEEINKYISIMMFNFGLLITRDANENTITSTINKPAGWLALSPAHVKRFIDEIGSLDNKFKSQCRYWSKITAGPYQYIHHNFPERLRKECSKFLRDFVAKFKGKQDTKRIVEHIHLNYKKELSWSEWILWLTEKGTIHPEFLLHGIDHLPCNSYPDKLKEFIQEGNFYDMVTSTSLDDEEEVAEIRVDKHHSYIGDTFVYHNSGKSDVMGQIATYIEHDCLATAHDQGLMRYLGLPDDEFVDMSFVASTKDQGEETVWAKYRNKRANSPWFQKYVPWVKHQESVQSTPLGMRKWRYIETEDSITNEHPKVHMRMNAWSTNSDSIVGKTRIGGVVDEMGRMKNTEGAGSAQEVYGGLESSCATVRGRVETRNLRNWLGFMLSMTSPKRSTGLEMQLLRVGQDIQKMMTIHKATWEFNPLQPYSTLKDEFLKNPVKAWRDFGARPIDSEYPLVLDPKEFVKKTVATSLKPTAKFEIFNQTENGYRYTSARCTHADLDPVNSHYIAVDAGKNWDAFAMASAHAEYGINEDGSTKVLTVFDWVLRIVPVEGTEIKFEFVEDVFRKLLQSQIIEMVRFDHWNSAHLIQKIRNMGVPDAMEENIKHEDYSKFVQDAKEGKVRMLPIPKYDLSNQNQRTMTPEKIAFVELLALEKDPDTEKVYNPQKGKLRGWNSNDTASVIVGAHKMVQSAFYVKDPFVRSNRNRRKSQMARRVVSPSQGLSAVWTPEK